MNDELTPIEFHTLWVLIASGGGAFENTLKPKLAKATRDALQRKGLIEVEKRVKPSLSKRKTAALHLQLTEHGWKLCGEQMTWPSPRIKSRADLCLSWLMPRLKAFFDRQVTAASLGDFINKSESSSATETLHTAEVAVPATLPASHTEQILNQRIRELCQELGTGRRIRIADLRGRLPDFSHDDVTQALWQLDKSNELTLYPFDEPRQMTPEDEAAAVLSSTGIPQHILYFGGIAS